MEHSKEAEALAGAGANIDSNDITFSAEGYEVQLLNLNLKHRGCVLHNYLSLPSWRFIKNPIRTLADSYYIVFKPLDHNYDPKFDGIEHVRKHLGKTVVMIIVREITAKKVHYHCMVWSHEDLSKLHEKCTNRYKIHVQSFPTKDKAQVHEYLVKESHTRYFYTKQKGLKRIPDIYVFSIF